MSDAPLASLSIEDTMITASVSDKSITTTSVVSSRSEKGKERSDIWKEFTKKSMKNGEIQIKCNHCKTTYKAIGSSTIYFFKKRLAWEEIVGPKTIKDYPYTVGLIYIIIVKFFQK